MIKITAHVNHKQTNVPRAAILCCSSHRFNIVYKESMTIAIIKTAEKIFAQTAVCFFLFISFSSLFTLKIQMRNPSPYLYNNNLLPDLPPNLQQKHLLRPHQAKIPNWFLKQVVHVHNAASEKAHAPTDNVPTKITTVIIQETICIIIFYLESFLNILYYDYIK